MNAAGQGASDAAAAFLQSLHERAAAKPRTILFPEATDIRTVLAVNHRPGRYFGQ